MSNLLLYGDESCHLDKDNAKFMVIGLVGCPEEYKESVVSDLHVILSKYIKNKYSEIKWTKISPNNTEMYKEIVQYFIDSKHLFFRAVMIDKQNIENEVYGQSHSEFYGKMYYRALEYIVVNKYKNYEEFDNYRTFIDISDTVGKTRISTLQKILVGMLERDGCGDSQFSIQEIRSYESILLQLSDILCGALQYMYRTEYQCNKLGKSQIVNMLCGKYGNCGQTIHFKNSVKFNVFYWQGRVQ